VAPHQPRQLGEIRRDPPRLKLGVITARKRTLGMAGMPLMHVADYIAIGILIAWSHGFA
jgi:hypothetical protein